MHNERIKLTDSIQDIAIKLSDFNPGALTVIMQIMEHPEIDPQDFAGPLGTLLALDSYGIYGTDIYVLYNDICDRNLVKMHTCLRACQLGYFKSTILADACRRQDYSGKAMIPIDELYQKVKARLKNFDTAGNFNS